MTEYAIRVLSRGEEIDAIADAWKGIRQQHDRPLIKQHPDWLPLETLGTTEAGHAPLVVALNRGDDLVGVAPSLLRRWNWQCRLGYTTVACFPLRLVYLFGEMLCAPADVAAQEALLLGLAGASVPFHALYFECLPLASPLWRVLCDTPALRRDFWVYSPAGITPHHWIHLPGTFEEYLTQFGGRTRRKLQNTVRKIEEACAGQLEVRRITRRDQVRSFLEQAEQVSKRSWQGARLGQVLRPSPAELERLGMCADRGWLRCYVLSGGAQPIAFVLGWQSDGVYYYEQIGYDPAWTPYSPGKVLLYRLLEDLFVTDTPRWLDFGAGDMDYKRIFGNHCYEETSVYVIRKSAYTALAYACHRSCTVVAANTRALLDRLLLREKIRHLLRGRAATPVSAPAHHEGALAKPGASR